MKKEGFLKILGTNILIYAIIFYIVEWAIVNALNELNLLRFFIM